ncbi:hypothetical protein H5410_020871 [Solanum commersonii]|uniref:Uncharacterized protein n=1 Tax=Solanum commersonii TaxID=4109 RepID=A0A9J5ZFI5_SOLCO|nr:hypothetical protein H5410_020871 [Solanum commersonii]
MGTKRLVCLEASGTKGGIILRSDSAVWKGEILQIGAYTLSCNFKAQLCDFECLDWCLCSYNSKLERRSVCEELADVKGLMEGHWVICGGLCVDSSPRKGAALGEFSYGGSFRLYRGYENGITSSAIYFTESDLRTCSNCSLLWTFENWWLNAKALKGKLKEWSRNEQGNYKLQKNKLISQMAELDSCLENRTLTEEEIAKKANLFMEYMKDV